MTLITEIYQFLFISSIIFMVYFFGDMNYLLHVEVATMNLHIGFVKYTMKNGLYKVQKMDNDDKENIFKEG